MKKSSVRRHRRRPSSHQEAGNLKPENKEQKFFGPAAQETFFQPNTALHRASESSPEEEAVQRSPGKENEKEKPAVKEEEKAHREAAPKDEKKEGDKVARAVADKEEKKPEDKLQREAGKKEEDMVHRAAAENGKEKEKETGKVQKKGDGAAQAADSEGKASDYVESIQGKGQSLAQPEQDFFGGKMGYDFSAVKVHTGKEAADSARDAHAKAYTYGNHIVFNEGQYDAGSDAGKTLLAHELTHVAQQGKAAKTGKGPAGGVRNTAARQVQRGFWGDVLGGITGVPDSLRKQGTHDLLEKSTRALTPVEAAEASRVYAGSIDYSLVRINESSILAGIGSLFTGSTGMGVTTGSLIGFDRKLNAAAGNADMAWLIHELGHVAQYAQVGMFYLREAIAAQATEGYSYPESEMAGKQMSDYNREQQADILANYYKRVLYGNSQYAADYTRLRNQAIGGGF